MEGNAFSPRGDYWEVVKNIDNIKKPSSPKPLAKFQINLKKGACLSARGDNSN